MSDKVSKAVVPAAGRGLRLRPLTGVVPKALFPLVDPVGRIRATLHWILAEAAAGGVESAAVVCSPEQRGILSRYFEVVREAGPATDLPPKVVWIEQPRPEGFGDAVATAAPFVAGEPFLLLLGDHVYRAGRGEDSPVRQVVEAFEARLQKGEEPRAMIGVQPVGPETLPRVGVAAGEPLSGGVYRCTRFVEKPDLACARRRLRAPGRDGDVFLACCGAYVFGAEIFAALRRRRESQGDDGGELELASALADLTERPGRGCFLREIAGRAYDIGTPECYAAAMAAFRRPPAAP